MFRIHIFLSGDPDAVYSSVRIQIQFVPSKWKQILKNFFLLFIHISSPILSRFTWIQKQLLSVRAGFRIRIDLMRFNADPDTDPDPAFFLIADPDSGSGSWIRIPDPDPGFGDLKLKKIYNKKFNFYFLDK